MTENPEEPKEEPIELLKKLYNEMQKVNQENQKLKTELATLKKSLAEDVPKLIDNKINELGTATENAIRKIGEVITAMRSQTQLAIPATAPTQGTMSQVVGKIGDIIDKALSGGGATGSLNEMDMEILKQAKQIQVLSLRNAFKALAKDSGIAETATHITVTP